MNQVKRTNKQQEIETVLAKERKNKADKDKLIRKKKQLKIEQQQLLDLDR